MKNKILLVLLAVSISACSTFNKGDKTPPPTIYSFASEITESALYNDLAVIAHDSLEGRETGTIGEEKAARYLAKRYTELGLKPVGDNNTFFQHFDLSQSVVDNITYRVTKSDGSLVDESTHSKESSSNFVTLFGGRSTLSGPIVFVGAGMKNDEGVNHFPEDMEGKWLLTLYDRSKTNMRFLQGAMRSGGALGVILLSGTDVAEFEDEMEQSKASFGQARGMQLAYLQRNTSSTSPAFNQINPELGAEILGLEDLDALTKIHDKIYGNPASFKPKELDFVLTHTPSSHDVTVTSKNIAAFLEGSDPELKDEVVVLSAHYDHVGIGRPDSTGDTIYNGADDDGSGTVATLQTARAMAMAKEAGVGPKRSVLFLSVSGEEKGLLGSRYYSDHPIFPIENTVANINIDMIGRVDPPHQGGDSSYVYVIGGKIISSQLDSMTHVANQIGIAPNIDLSDRYNDLNDPNQFYRRSDHWNFGRLGIPFVFFFNGTHEDYHGAGDEIEKITFKPYLQRTHLVYNLTAVLANSPVRPIVDNQEFIEKTQATPR